MSLLVKLLEAINELEKLRIGTGDMIILAPSDAMTVMVHEMWGQENQTGTSWMHRRADGLTMLGGVIVITDDFEKLVVRSMKDERHRVEVKYDE